MISYKVKCNSIFWKSIYDFVLLSHSNCRPILVHLDVISHQSLSDLEFWPSRSLLTRSNVMAYFESPYMTSYWCPIETMGLSLSVWQLQAIKIWRTYVNRFLKIRKVQSAVAAILFLKSCWNSIPTTLILLWRPP